jgi:hypothetical protein
MIRKTAFRAVVQNNDSVNLTDVSPKNKYPLTVLSASCTEQYPFQSSTADIKVASNSKKGTSGYSLPIYSDDFIRLQVSSKLNNSTWTNWQDLFVGQIQSAKSVYGSANTLDIHAVDLMNEALWTPINETSTWSSALDATSYFNYFINYENLTSTPIKRRYRRYLTYASAGADTGAIIPSFSCTFNQTMLADVITSMEEQSAYTYRAYAIPIFDSNQNMSEIYLGWKKLPVFDDTKDIFTQVTNRYAVIEGSWRYIDSEFASSIEELRNRVTVIGSSNNDILDAKEDPASIANYGKRARVDTLNWIVQKKDDDITSDDRANYLAQCVNIATTILSYTKDSSIVGNATIVGTSRAHPGDLVYCKSPSQEVNGSPVETVLPVYRVSQNISPSGVWTTSLDLGKLNKSAYDYIGMMSRNIKNLQRNAVKC